MPTSCMDQDATLSNTVCPADCVRWGPISPPSNKAAQQPLYFSAHVYCGQTAAWIKMPLGMDVGLGPGHVTIDGTELPQTRGHSSPPPIFGPCLLWPCKRLDGGTRDVYPLQGKWHSSHSTFRPTLLWHGRSSQLLLNICSNIPLSFNDAVHS